MPVASARLAFVMAAAGCLAQVGPQADPFAGIRIVWPPPPASPRISFTGIIEGDGGLPVARSRLARALIGRAAVQLARPFGVCADAEGRVIVADADGPAVLVYDYPARRLVMVREFEGGRLASPIGVAPGPGRSFYVTDSELGQVLQFDLDGNLIRRLASGPEVKRPTGIARDPATGNVLVTDTAAGEVLVFAESGRRLRAFGRGELNRPTGVTVDGKGTAYVADTLNFRIRSYEISSGRSLGFFGATGDGSGAIRDVRGLAVGPGGNVFVVDRAFSRVQVFDPGGRFLLAFGGPGAGPGQFDLPSDICVAQDGRMYVTDSYNGRVQAFRLLGGGE